MLKLYINVIFISKLYNIIYKFNNYINIVYFNDIIIVCYKKNSRQY